MPLRPCWVCRQPVPDGRCPRHPPTAARYRPRRRSVVEGYYDRDWQRLRLYVLDRDGWRCRYCGGQANTADHVVPRSRGGASSRDNVVACCAGCNTSKKNRTITEWIAAGTAPVQLVQLVRIGRFLQA